MLTIDLDPEGRLRSFVAIPPQEVPQAGHAAAPHDWNTALAEAGLDAKAFAQAEPVWLPRVPFDTVAGFSGPMPGGGATLKVVAAALPRPPRLVRSGRAVERALAGRPAARGGPREDLERRLLGERTVLQRRLGVVRTA